MILKSLCNKKSVLNLNNSLAFMIKILMILMDRATITLALNFRKTNTIKSSIDF